MPGDMVKIIIDRVYNKIIPKPIYLCPGYDMEHVFNYQPQTDNYRYEKVVEIEKQYDYLSIIRPHETSQQWANRVRDSLQELGFHTDQIRSDFTRFKSDLTDPNLSILNLDS
ncbi:hypothetical protein RclHR1_06910003 [Rhizophagus clarus]|uniref:Uncharacterized protein n=1 Tax=Rhizophagus clarus TaxID=94130 RepID=A0A2Z6RU61_9GLOM|nr:hypothetical protein RclHR1_06910003 [Rhizophagus clarus]GES96809.1 hypothetical protein GLOIN_2v1770803 [Rhizophagus clarus]